MIKLRMEMSRSILLAATASTAPCAQTSFRPARSAEIIFFLNDTATTEIYTTYDTLSLHDALPILAQRAHGSAAPALDQRGKVPRHLLDRKSTRLNSSHRRFSRMPSSARKKKK